MFRIALILSMKVHLSICILYLEKMLKQSFKNSWQSKADENKIAKKVQSMYSLMLLATPSMVLADVLSDVSSSS